MFFFDTTYKTIERSYSSLDLEPIHIFCSSNVGQTDPFSSGQNKCMHSSAKLFMFVNMSTTSSIISAHSLGLGMPTSLLSGIFIVSF